MESCVTFVLCSKSLIDCISDVLCERVWQIYVYVLFLGKWDVESECIKHINALKR